MKELVELWGRKYVILIALALIWTYLRVFNLLSEDAYVTLMLASIGIISGLSTAGKFKDGPR